MAVSSFLSEGAIPIPQGSALTDMTKQQVLPDWYTNYAKDILSGQQAIANRPYATAPMPRVAGFTQAQEKSFGMTDTAAGAYKPMLDAATAATQGAMSAPGSLATSQPYFNQATSTSGASAAQPFLGTAGQLTGQSTQPMGQQASQPYFNQAINMNGVTAATPGLQQGTQFTAQSTDALGMNAAQPYLTQAGQTSVSNIGSYMNPYNDAVTNRIGELGARNLSENILPQIEGRYIQAGQLGYGGRDGMGTPSGMMTDTARALRDVNADILAQQTAALQSGYTQAAGLAGTDLGRQSQLAQTAGSLGTQQQGALAQAGQQMANIGQTYGTLTGTQQRALTDVGTQAGQFGVSQQAALAQAGQQMGALGQISGSLTQQQQDLLAQIGTSAGNLSGTDIARQLTGAQQLAGLGEDAQRLGLTGAGALGSVGALQQGQGQKNLDVAYGDFLRQQGYPQEQVNNMVAALKGVATAVPSADKTYGVSPVGSVDTSKTSTGSDIAAILAALSGFVGTKKP